MTGGGLSRRGWILLVGATAVVAAVLLGAAALAIGGPMIGEPAGHARANASAASQPNVLQSAPAHAGAMAANPQPKPTPAQTATVPTRPVAALNTGDCLQLYPSPWADGYPVVDCAEPHLAQVLSRGVLPQPAGAAFPGTEALGAQVAALCQDPSLPNWDWVAVWNEDVQTDVRYPKTAAQWDSGERSYYCFIYTFSRHELTGSAVAEH